VDIIIDQQTNKLMQNITSVIRPACKRGVNVFVVATVRQSSTVSVRLRTFH